MAFYYTDSKTNAEQAYNLGKTLAGEQKGKCVGDIKLKRSDKVTSISAATNSISARGQQVEINSELLFMQITCTIMKHKQMKEYLKYEFA